MNQRTPKYAQSLLCAGLGCALAATASAQDPQPRRQSSVLLEEIVVTARKREENAQDVPLSISAFNSDQLAALKVRNLVDLAVGMPSVVLDEVGTSRGYANFSIRGLGVNSSIPSIDPAVAVVVDGVYLGTNASIVFDNFDIDTIEVLRGPQGTLFGRNVTGGAVLMNTKTPTEEFEANARVAYETPERGGAMTILQGSVSGGLTDSLSAKLAVYFNDDQGALVNGFDGSDHAAYEQMIIRPVVAWRPSDNFELIARYERQEVEADGPSAQSHTNGFGVPGTPVNFDRDSYDFSIDEPGGFDLEVDFFNLTANWDVLGGTVTNVFGWREASTTTNADIDAQPIWMFHSDTFSGYDQISNELRYNGLFLNDRLNFTGGLFLFESELSYDENRRLLGVATGPLGLPALQQEGGGLLDVSSVGVFASADYDLTDRLTLSAGLRWTKEDKDARIATLTLNQSGPDGANACFIGEPNGPSYAFATTECNYDFVDDESWDFWSPKIGAMYDLSDSSRLFASYTIGYRSGGYNLRNTEFPITFGPGPFDTEEVGQFEIGYKSEWDKGQLNLAVYRTDISDMQREVNLPSPTAGVLQIIQNTADAEIFGFEVDGTFALTESFTMKGSVGWMSANYTSVKFDLNGDGAVDKLDEALDIPRAPELTYSISGIYDVDIGRYGYLSTRVSYSYRDAVFFTDNNRGFINEQDILDAAMDFHTNDGNWIFSLYGRNLMDTVRHGNDTQLPTALGGVPLGGTFSPLNRPKTYGLEVTYNL